MLKTYPMVNPVPTITVVIPAYNEEKYLPRCLKSLAKQNYPRSKFNIIVVDNNSTDKTASIARKFGAKVIKEKKQGHVFSLNTGMKHAKGDIIAITDSDTIVSTSWLKTLAKCFEDESVVAVTGSLNLQLKTKAINKIFKSSYQIFSNIHTFINRPHIVGPNMAVRKSAFLKLKGVDTRYIVSGDVEIGLRLRKFGKVKFEKNLTVTTSPRRFKSGFGSFIRNSSIYLIAYIYCIWLNKPPQLQLIPIR